MLEVELLHKGGRVYVSLVVVLWLMISFIFTIITSLSACSCYSHFHTLTLLYVLDHMGLEGAAVCISTFACCIEIRFAGRNSCYSCFIVIVVYYHSCYHSCFTILVVSLS